MNRIDQLMRRVSNRQQGFTMIELMVVVAVIAIIAAIAYPAYTGQVRKGKRGQAKADLVAVASSMERCFTQQNSYNNCWAGTNTLPATNNTSATNGQVNYTVALANVTAQTYQVVATPAAGTDQVNDTCGILTIDQTGARTVSGTGTNCF